ncbi:MAG: hypothetical protein NVSMB6_20660 [Burkholderiaceae bacterium]
MHAGSGRFSLSCQMAWAQQASAPKLSFQRNPSALDIVGFIDHFIDRPEDPYLASIQKTWAAAGFKDTL